MRVAPRKGCGLAWRFSYFAKPQLRVVGTSPSVQTAHSFLHRASKTRGTAMTTAIGVASQPHDDGLSSFMSVRARLFGIAYRMLGSAAEAEDVVQDVWLRWQTADRSLVRDAAAFLVTTATRLAINVM